MTEMLRYTAAPLHPLGRASSREQRARAEGTCTSTQGFLEYEEFRLAIRKGAKLSPVTVTDPELRALFFCVDQVRRGHCAAPPTGSQDLKST